MLVNKVIELKKKIKKEGKEKHQKSAFKRVEAAMKMFCSNLLQEKTFCSTGRSALADRH